MKQRGQTLILVSIMMIALIGVGGLVIDLGNVYSVRSKMRNAADVIALASARELPNTSAAMTKAAEYAGYNGITTTLLTVNTPYHGDSQRVEVIVRRIQPNYFMRIFGFTSTPVVGRAVARAVSGSSHPLGQYTLFGKNDLELQGGSVVDIYNSKSGTYLSQRTNYDNRSHNWYANFGALIGSDKETKIGGGSLVAGSSNTGDHPCIPPTSAQNTLTGTPTHVIGNVTAGVITKVGQPLIDGTQTQCLGCIPETKLPPIDLSVVSVTNDNPSVPGCTGYSACNLTINANETVTVGCGNYYFNEVVINGNGNLISNCTTGVTNMYAINGWTQSGQSSVANTSHDPTKLALWFARAPGITGDCTRGFGADITGGSDFYASVYNPYDTVTILGNGDVYGPVIAEEIYMNGGASVHGDTAVRAKFSGAPIINLTE